MTWTQTILNLKDANNNTQPVIAYTDGTNYSFAHPLLDNTGTIIAPATSGNQATANTSLAAIATSVAGATPAGTNTIGNVGLVAGTAVAGKFGIDQTTPGTTNGVQVNAALPAGTNTIGAISAGVNVVAGNTLTRPANTTAYAFGQLIANSTTAGSVVAPTIAAARGTNVPTAAIRCRLQKSNTSTTNAIFRVHFWNSAPTVSTGDGTTFTPTFASYCGSFDVTCNLAGSDVAFGIGIPTSGPSMVFAPASGTSNLYYLIEARAAYTPASGEVFTPTLEIQ